MEQERERERARLAKAENVGYEYPFRVKNGLAPNALRIESVTQR